MLTLPDDPNKLVRLVGLDPGTEMLGVCVLWVDLVTQDIVEFKPFTIQGTKLPQKHWLEEINSARRVRIQAHEDNLTRLLRIVDPLSIACESPFFNRRFPQAYGALIQIVAGIENAVLRYDPWKRLTLVDPLTVKRTVGAAYNAKKSKGKTREQKKDEVRDALLIHPLLPKVFLPLLDKADEHAIDATAVAMYQYFQFFNKTMACA